MPSRYSCLERLLLYFRTLTDDFSLHRELIFPFFCSLQVVSAVCGGITDLSFHLIGYTWQILNCFLTAGYSVS
jgi:hypothetical protein